LKELFTVSFESSNVSEALKEDDYELIAYLKKLLIKFKQDNLMDKLYTLQRAFYAFNVICL